MRERRHCCTGLRLAKSSRQYRPSVSTSSPSPTRTSTLTSGTWVAKPASVLTGGATTPTQPPSSSWSTRRISNGCRRPRRSSPPCSTRRSSRTRRSSSSLTSRISPGPRARARSPRRCAWASCGTATGASWRARPWTAAASTKEWTGSCKPYLRSKWPDGRPRCHNVPEPHMYNKERRDDYSPGRPPSHADGQSVRAGRGAIRYQEDDDTCGVPDMRRKVH